MAGAGAVSVLLWSVEKYCIAVVVDVDVVENSSKWGFFCNQQRRCPLKGYNNNRHNHIEPFLSFKYSVASG